MGINPIDILVVIFISWLGFKGFKKGIVIELTTLVALVLGALGAIKFSGITTEVLQTKISSEYLPLIAFGITFLLIVLGVFLLGKLIEKFMQAIALGLVNKSVGAAFGACKALLISSYIVSLFASFNQKANLVPQEKLEKSLTYHPLLSLGTDMIAFVQTKNLLDLENFPIQEVEESTEAEQEV